MWFKGFHEAMWIKGNRSKRRPTKSKKKKKDNPSHTGNRTRATAVRAPDPNH